MNEQSRRQITGWSAVVFSTIVACVWATWGIIENFHEGWYFESILPNLGLMFAQYLSPMLIFVVVTLVSIRWPQPGAVLHGILALFLAWFFRAAANMVSLVFILPLIGLGALYWFGRPRPRWAALALAAGLPLLTLVVAGVGPAYRVSQRFDDGDMGARLIQGNGIRLIWAPEGPGWPRQGADWHEAQKVCQHLDEDGRTTDPDPRQIWRLPTVEEAVRSMARHGQNSGGVWDAGTVTAAYVTAPDKESPLWDVHSQVIYWWTATEIDEEQAYIIVYDGRVWPRAKQFGPAYLGFRCVRQPESP